MRKLKNIDLDDLIEEGIINENIATKIVAYQAKQEEAKPNRLGIILSVLGAALIGLGIMLIVAHNWDNLNRPTKTFLAFLPMIIGQIACAFTFFKRKDEVSWREGSATFLFFAVGACIGMISQIYNLDGELGSFLLTWMLLMLPIVYALKSSIVSLLYIGGITWYATNCGYANNHEPYLFWGLLVAAIPHYYHLYQNRPNGNAFNYHSWAIALSVLIALGTWANSASMLMWIAYVSLLGVYFLIGSQPFFSNRRSINNPFLLLGLFGTISLFLTFTFFFFWEEIVQEKMHLISIYLYQEFWVAILLTALGLYLFVKQRPAEGFKFVSPIPLGFIFFLLVFLIGYNMPIIGMVLSNIFVLGVGIFYIHRGNQLNQLGVLNLGLLTLAALIICRFFDLNLSFVTRGILFVLVGIGFFLANYQLIQKRKV